MGNKPRAKLVGSIIVPIDEGLLLVVVVVVAAEETADGVASIGAAVAHGLAGATGTSSGSVDNAGATTC